MEDEEKVQIIKTGKLEVRITDQFKNYLVKSAADCGLTFPEFLRLCLMEGAIIVVEKYKYPSK